LTDLKSYHFLIEDYDLQFIKYPTALPEGGWTSWDQYTESTRDYIALFPSLKELRELGFSIKACFTNPFFGLNLFNHKKAHMTPEQFEILETVRQIAEENDCRVALYGKT